MDEMCYEPGCILLYYLLSFVLICGIVDQERVGVRNTIAMSTSTQILD